MFEDTLSMDNCNFFREAVVDVKEYFSQEEQNILLLKNFFTLTILLSGRVAFTKNGQNDTLYAPNIICFSNKDEISNFVLYHNTKISIVYFNIPLFDSEFANSNNQQYFYYSKQDEFSALLNYVNYHINQNIPLDDLYHKFYIGTQSIEKQFNSNLHMTYKQYVRKKRFDIAKQYLKSTSLSIKEIAGKIGYSSTQGFCKFFKEMSGITPLTFRKNDNNFCS